MIVLNQIILMIKGKSLENSSLSIMLMINFGNFAVYSCSVGLMYSGITQMVQCSTKSFCTLR